MRFGLAAAIAAALFAALACNQNGQYASGLPAGSACATDYDCEGELNCVFAIASGCMANGVCTNMQQAGVGKTCPPMNQVCTCQLQTIDVPSCWTGFSTQPSMFSGPCSALDAGAVDASKD
jgi:hypothetical protein